VKAVALLGLMLLGFGCTKTPVDHNHQVAMRDFNFSPESLDVAVGDTVTWMNQGDNQHTTTSGEVGAPDGKWDSGVLSSGGSFMYVFATAGNYHYYCQLHGSMGMKGVVSTK
jgi:plastocyanin